MNELLFYAAVWASSLCYVLYKMHSKFEKIWDAINELDNRKLDLEP